MFKRYVINIFAKSSGLEISATNKLDADKIPIAGSITMRFFPLEIGKKNCQIRFVMEPVEANDIACAIRCIIKSIVPQRLKMPPHKFSKDDTDILTTLMIEKYGEPAKFALVISRGKGNTINIPMSREKLSLDQAWLSVYENKVA